MIFVTKSFDDEAEEEMNEEGDIDESMLDALDEDDALDDDAETPSEKEVEDEDEEDEEDEDDLFDEDDDLLEEDAEDVDFDSFDDHDEM